MYLETCRIRTIKCLDNVTLNFRNADGSIRLWNVLIGDNGTGKTTLLQAIAIALMGEKAASILLPRPEGWVRDGETQGTIEATIVPGAFDADAALTKTEEANLLLHPLPMHYTIENRESGVVSMTNTTKKSVDKRRLHVLDSMHGWFAAGYGPLRRLRGSTLEAQRLVEDGYREARFITLFREDAALSHSIEWLMDLDHIRRDTSNPEHEQASTLISTVETVLAQILPEGWSLKGINSRGIFFQTPFSEELRIGDLSDGYRAMLALSLDMLHHMSKAYASLTHEMLPHISGVVLIDELDAHLHPTWQHKVGQTLKQCFPSIQFIVATHSPFISQIADDDGLYTLREEGGSVRLMQEETSVRGWRVDQILSILFETGSAYEPETEERLREYGQLKILSNERNLTVEETQRFQELHEWVEQYLAPPGETRAEMIEFRALDKHIQMLSAQLRERHNHD